MKLKVFSSLLFIFLLLSSLSNGQVLTGNYYVDSNTPGYTLHQGDGDRIFDYEVVFDKPFDEAPTVYVTVTLIDEIDNSKMRYHVVPKGITRDGFIVEVKVWSDTRINAFGGQWIASLYEEPTPPPPPPTTTLTFENIYFDYNKCVLKTEAKVELDKIADVLVKNPSVKIMIHGHTCDRGTDAYNKKLGERRANAAKDYLVKKGIDATRLTTKSEGENLPAIANTTEEDRKKNRRVEFKEIK
ncbi:MAG: OmpA family protein [Ignavibacteriales bacterium]|nr:OmpA family protein [Ignavibacteriales bacterium]